MKKYLILLLLFVPVLSGCGGTATRGPAQIPTRPQPEATATLTPFPTRTHSPTKTFEPTLAAAATFYRQTQEAEEVGARATVQALDEYQRVFGGECGSYIAFMSVSPDGNWLAQDCSYDKLQVINKNSSVIWEVDYKDIFDPIEQSGSVYPLYWTRNSSYLYFTSRFCCADTDTMSNGDMLYRMDLSTGEWKMLIDGYFNYYSFSPTGRRLLYILNDQAHPDGPFLVLHIMDLSTGEEAKYEFPQFEQAGNVTWKADGLHLAMMTKTGNYFDENVLFSIVLLDVRDGRSETLIADDPNAPAMVDWSDDDILTVESFAYLGPDGSGHYYSLVERRYYDLKIGAWITPMPDN
jgi:hypothetical protein